MNSWAERNRARFWWMPLVGLLVWPLVAVLLVSQGISPGPFFWLLALATSAVAVATAIRERAKGRDR